MAAAKRRSDSAPQMRQSGGYSPTAQVIAPQAKQRPFGGLPFPSGGCLSLAPGVLLRAAPLSSFNFLPQSTIFFAPSQRFFHILFILIEDEQKCTVVPRFFDEITVHFGPHRYFHRLQTGFLLIELLFSLPSDSKKAVLSRLGESRFLFTC